MPRPLVAITATSRQDGGNGPERALLNAAYVEAVVRAGGIPVISPPAAPQLARELVERVDAVLLSGGEDVDPQLFGAEPHPRLGRVTRARDLWEIAVATEARARRTPTLGVCRGIQVLNVALGGTLIQDIPSERPGASPHEQSEARNARTHALSWTEGSRLERLMGDTSCVNSMHHQAIDRLAEGFTVTATAGDGIVEGIEWTRDDWWCVGVQWHPEELDGADAGLFHALTAAADRTR